MAKDALMKLYERSLGDAASALLEELERRDMYPPQNLKSYQIAANAKPRSAFAISNLARTLGVIGHKRELGSSVPVQGGTSTDGGKVRTDRLPDGRILVGVTPAHLASLYSERHTEIQADKLFEAFAGKWMRVSGSIEDVFATQGGGAGVAFPYEGPNEPSVMMYFEDKGIVNDQLRTLKIGDPITVIGQIESATAGVIVLENCELG